MLFQLISETKQINDYNTTLNHWMMSPWMSSYWGYRGWGLRRLTFISVLCHQCISLLKFLSLTLVCGMVLSMQPYVIKIASKFRKISVCLWLLPFPPPIKQTVTVIMSLKLFLSFCLFGYCYIRFFFTEFIIVRDFQIWGKNTLSYDSFLSTCFGLGLWCLTPLSTIFQL
jgi:hypothetical protein